MNDLNNRTHASARGGQRANGGGFRVDVPRLDRGLLMWSMQARKLMRDTGASAEQVIALARADGVLQCVDADVPALVETLSLP